MLDGEIKTELQAPVHYAAFHQDLHCLLKYALYKSFFQTRMLMRHQSTTENTINLINKIINILKTHVQNRSSRQECLCLRIFNKQNK